MSKISDKKVGNKMTMNQKRKTSGGGVKKVNSMTIAYFILNVFGSINYLSEGALTQPTLSFTTAGSQSGKN